jgi:iron(III) transport system ATP-binding protein
MRPARSQNRSGYWPVASASREWQMPSFGAERPKDHKGPMDKIVSPDFQKHARRQAASHDPSARSLPDSAALVVDRLTRRYGAVAAVDGLSLTVTPGEIVALIGHSGSGKSTLLRLVAGLERPSAGRIFIAGREASGPGRYLPPEERGIGMMFQDYALFPHLTVLRNVMFGLRRMPAAEARDIARRALDRVGLSAREEDYPHTLSGGEQQRVALARALVPRPGVLLMDEPFSNLDRRTRDIVREETTAVLRESGATAVLVTHDPDEAMRMADRIMLMQAGRIVQGGSAEELYRHPASLLVARFFSEFNEIDTVCRSGRVATPLGTFPAPGIAEGAAATVCIRPHDLRLAEWPGEGGQTGWVVSRHFVGDAQLVYVSVDGLARPLQMLAPMHATPVRGEMVTFDLAEADVLVFPTGG